MTIKNLFYRSNDKNSLVLKEAVVPLFWFEELSEVDDDQIDNIKLRFVFPEKYEEAVILGSAGFGVVLVLISLCCCCCCGRKRVSCFAIGLSIQLHCD